MPPNEDVEIPDLILFSNHFGPLALRETEPSGK
jgi:hypothetical protein